MKITRALLLSSQKQAEAWERPQVGQNIFGMALYETKYRYLVDDQGEDGKYRFRVYCVHQERKEDRLCNVVAPEAHVDEVLSDTAALINFLRRYQIDFESAWQPVENREE